MFQNHKQGHMFAFKTGKVFGVLMKFVCIVHTTLPQIQWCNFCIENPNLDFVFVAPTLIISKLQTIVVTVLAGLAND